jgi:hypothetical protein
MEVISCTPLPLYPVPFEWVPEPLWTPWRREHLLPLPEIEPQFHVHPATDRPYTTELSEPAPPEIHYVVNKLVTVFTLRLCAYHKLSKNVWYGNVSDHIGIFTKESYLFKLALILMRRRQCSVGTVIVYGLDDPRLSYR